MSQAEDVLQGIYEAINTGNLALLEKYVAPDYIEHTDGFQGVEPFAQQVAAFRSRVPRPARDHRRPAHRRRPIRQPDHRDRHPHR